MGDNNGLGAQFGVEIKPVCTPVEENSFPTVSHFHDTVTTMAGRAWLDITTGSVKDELHAANVSPHKSVKKLEAPSDPSETKPGL